MWPCSAATWPHPAGPQGSPPCRHLGFALQARKSLISIILMTFCNDRCPYIQTITLHTNTPQEVMSCCLGCATVEHVHLPIAGFDLRTSALENTDLLRFGNCKISPNKRIMIKDFTWTSSHKEDHLMRSVLLLKDHTKFMHMCFCLHTCSYLIYLVTSRHCSICA